MNISEQIVAPFDSTEDLLKLIKLYLQMNKDNVKAGFLYSEAVSEDIADEEYDIYRSEFEKRILIPQCTKFYEYLKKIDPVKADELIEKMISKAKTDDQKIDIRNNLFYPMKDLFKTFKYFKTFEELYQFCIELDMQIREDREKINDEFKKLPEETQKNIKNIQRFGNSIVRHFWGGEGIMGFFIDPQKFVLDKKIELEKDEAKLYINAGVQTYKVAQLFLDKCIEKGLNYRFKVVDGKDFIECGRVEKMCIYTEIEDIPKYVEIIRQIIIENPDIVFKKSTILCGYIDGVIGIGTDKFGEYASYNRKMSAICGEALLEVFGQIEQKDVMEYVNRYPRLIEVLKLKIKEKAQQKGLSYNFVCLKDEDIERLKNIENVY